MARLKVPVYALSVASSPAKYSRCVRWISTPESKLPAAAWADFLLGPKSDHLRGAVLMVAGDIGLEVLMTHRAALAQRFRLDLVNPADSGLAHAVSILEGVESVAVTRFTVSDVVRHPLVGRIVEAYDADSARKTRR